MDENNMNAGRKRNPFLAAIANLFVCGLGHIYAGQPKRFFITFAIYIAFSLVIVSLNLVPQHFFFWLSVLLLAIGFYIFIIVDVVRICRKTSSYQLKKYNRWYIYLAYAVLLFGGKGVMTSNPYVFAQLTSGFTPFRIVTTNMVPALQVDDTVVCNKKAYNDNVLPQVNDIVATHIGEKNVIRRIGAIDGPQVHLVADNPTAESPVTVPDKIDISQITCRVTYISISSDWRRIGKNVQ